MLVCVTVRNGVAVKQIVARLNTTSAIELESQDQSKAGASM